MEERKKRRIKTKKVRTAGKKGDKGRIRRRKKDWNEIIKYKRNKERRRENIDA